MNERSLHLIKHQTYIKATPEKVFQTLTTEAGWNGWFTDRTTIQMNSDGTGEIWFRWLSRIDKETEIIDGGKIIAAFPYQSFIFQWKPGKSKTTVEFRLHPYKEGTLLSLEERGYSSAVEDVKACIGCATGWGEALTLLKVFLEHGINYKEDIMIDS